MSFVSSIERQAKFEAPIFFLFSLIEFHQRLVQTWKKKYSLIRLEKIQFFELYENSFGNLKKKTNSFEILVVKKDSEHYLLFNSEFLFPTKSNLKLCFMEIEKLVEFLDLTSRSILVIVIRIMRWKYTKNVRNKY